MRVVPAPGGASLFVLGRGVPVPKSRPPSPPPPPAPVVLEGPLHLEARVEYATARRGGQGSVGVVTVHAKKMERRQVMDIICVLDVSGSMQGTKMRLMQDAVKFIIQESQEKDRLGIISFNDEAACALWLRGMDKIGKPEARSAVFKLNANGGTCIAKGLRLAVETAEQRCLRPVSAILLLTDGQDGSSGATYTPLIRRIQRLGCALYCFGFGADHDARLLADLAEQAQTPFTFIEDERMIRQAFAGTIGGLSSIVAQKVEVSLRGRVSLKAVHTPFVVTQGETRTVVQIPDMMAGERRDLVVEMAEPPDAGSASDEVEVVLLEASARYFHLAAGSPAEADPVTMRQRRLAWGEELPEAEPEPDPEVVTQRNRVEVAQALQEAAALCDEGRFEEARERLSAHEEHMRSRPHMSPMDEGLMLELVDARERMHDEAAWKGGGMAEVRDAMQMHRTQRATNAAGSDGPSGKSCKAMYLTAQQQAWVSRLR